jgi:hypothetical protein
MMRWVHYPERVEKGDCIVQFDLSGFFGNACFASGDNFISLTRDDRLEG